MRKFCGERNSQELFLPMASVLPNAAASLIHEWASLDRNLCHSVKHSPFRPCKVTVGRTTQKRGRKKRPTRQQTGISSNVLFIFRQCTASVSGSMILRFLSICHHFNKLSLVLLSGFIFWNDGRNWAAENETIEKHCSMVGGSRSVQTWDLHRPALLSQGLQLRFYCNPLAKSKR